jgi:uncharacterized coiled-coil protein SlyX
MARGRKKYTLDEQYELTVKQIGELETTLKDLKVKRKELEVALKDRKLSELNNLIVETGLSIDEIKDLIQKGNPA